jgi:hypothetical protein
MKQGAPGKSSPAVFAFTFPRPPLRSITTLIGQKQNPRDHSRVCALPISNGASPIASALVSAWARPLTDLFTLSANRWRNPVNRTFLLCWD